MNWVKVFIEAAIILAKKHSKEIKEFFAKLSAKTRDYWNGKKIAILGSTAVGKNSLYCRLRRQPIPEEHLETRSPEKVPSFLFKEALPNRKPLRIRVRRAINVGGDEEQRARQWAEACRDADVIFYMITIDQLRKGRFEKGTRIGDDLAWLAARLGQSRHTCLVHILVNKVDLVLVDGKDLSTLRDELSPEIKSLEQIAKRLFGPYSDRLTGISPTSMKDDHIFANSFSLVLQQVYDAVHVH